jgi:hypothetical protein
MDECHGVLAEHRDIRYARALSDEALLREILASDAAELKAQLG